MLLLEQYDPGDKGREIGMLLWQVIFSAELIPKLAPKGGEKFLGATGIMR
jgi:hypothetical protein